MAITITTDRNEAKISSTIRINSTMSGGDVFPDVSKMVVYVGGLPAKVLYHSMTGSNTGVTTVVVPTGIDSGKQSVKIFVNEIGVTSNTVYIDVFYSDETFVDDELTSYASRFVPRPMGTITVYSRDLAYTNYSEITDANCVVQNVLSIVLTRRGERLFNSGIGTRILDLLFSPVESPEMLERTLINEIKTQVGIYEKRAKILADMSFVDFNEDSNALFVVLYIEVPGGSVKELGITLSAVKKDEY